MDKELIERIATQLQSHEENYSPGAWERFSEKENKRRGFLYWPLWTAAAVILIIGALFFSLDKKGNQNHIVVTKPKVETKISPENTNQKPVSTDENNPILSNNPKSADQNLVANDISKKSILIENSNQKNSSQLNIVTKSDEIIKNYNSLENSLTGINLSNSKNKSFKIVTAEKKPQPIKKTTFEDLLAQDSKADQYKAASKNSIDSKWEPGVYIAPAMGNDNKVNMNYGFSLSYAVANKLSISSGVSYASLSSTETLDASAPQSLSGKNLESVNAKVSGINVPLELRYKISEKLYTGIGVSALAILNNSQNNTYLVNQVQSTVVSDAAGYSTSKNYIVQEKKSEPEPTIDPDKYIGFYNFSLGYKQKISTKKNIAIEPFLRLPMKTFSKENLNLTNGGLRIKFDF
ncbi:hypothetical protein EZ449_09780 [Pedobacter frigidisoli]|uniref:Outer membrane protein beta-barrel domain-containing protein n=1 Tax=Pedobacter frigidisoli TaxID=2530455 RepID=A0A4R0P4G2_9SPHI|nr:hypothetical protein [Pedobacter frigidisoli]TCD10622.1 hypothetical protein EZ449_09780 [Pedobacter frigidisoli]